MAPPLCTPGYQTHVFLDDSSIQLGTERPLALRQALQTSRCLLAVLSAQYFGSPWCLAEWKTMQEREKVLGLRTQERPSGLIYPVMFSGKEFFPNTVLTMQMKDLRQFAATYPAFKNSSMYGSFQKAIREVCEDLSKMILEAPPWDKNWPVVIPEEEPINKSTERPGSMWLP